MGLIKGNDLAVFHSRELQLTREQASQFYVEHQGDLLSVYVYAV